MNNEIILSIVCNTYNHEKFIESTLNSFLFQHHGFKFEILIMDDASSDATKEIIKKYKEKHPNIIKPIYHKENLYSKGIKVGMLNAMRARGKYIAICEGDDYWIDPNKIKKQINFLELNPDFSACVHASMMVDGITGENLKEIRAIKKNKEFYTSEIIAGGGGFFSTNSIVYRNIDYDYKPDFYFNNMYSFGDYQLIIYLSLVGKVYYFNEIMSAYRYMVPGSWSARNFKTTKKRIDSISDLNSFLCDLNLETNYKFDKVIKSLLVKNFIAIGYLNNECNLVEYLNKEYFYNFSFFEKLFIRTSCELIRLFRLLKSIKRKLFDE